MRGGSHEQDRDCGTALEQPCTVLKMRIHHFLHSFLVAWDTLTQTKAQLSVVSDEERKIIHGGQNEMILWLGQWLRLNESFPHLKFEIQV